MKTDENKQNNCKFVCVSARVREYLSMCLCVNEPKHSVFALDSISIFMSGTRFNVRTLRTK